MRVFLLLVVALCVLSSCHSGGRNDARIYYRSQMEGRLQELRAADSPDTAAARELIWETEKIVLVSKDIENPQAALNMHRDLFDRFCKSFGIKREDFPDPSPNPGSDEIEIQFRENALSFVNRLAMADTTRPHLFTAH